MVDNISIDYSAYYEYMPAIILRTLHILTYQIFTMTLL